MRFRAVSSVLVAQNVNYECFSKQESHDLRSCISGAITPVDVRILFSSRRPVMLIRENAKQIYGMLICLIVPTEKCRNYLLSYVFKRYLVTKP